MKPNPDFFDLDITRLDNEWVLQPRMYKEHADKLADARAELERAKADQELVAAELDRDIRRNPMNFGLAKLTEDVIKRTIILQQQYRNAQERTIIARHQVDVLSAAVTTLDHRKKALENLVQLWLASYFSEPRVKGETRQALEKASADRVFNHDPVPAPKGRKSR